MIEPIVHQGNFWATDDPQAQANGELIVDLDGRVTLKTDGFFRDPNDDQADGFFSEPASRNGTHLIEGQTISENIKLVGCFVKAQHGGMFGALGSLLPTVEWHCSKAYVGAAFSGDEPAAIRSAEIVIPAYGEWVSGFPDIQWSGNGETRTMSYPANPVEKSVRWSLGTLTVSQLIRVTDVQFTRHGTRTTTVTTSFGILVEFDESQPVDTVMEIVTALQALVTIAQGQACNRLSIRVYETPNLSEGIQVYGQTILHSTGPVTKHGQMFSYNEIGSAEGIARWVDYAIRKRQLWNPMLADIYNQPTFITDRTAHLLIACEILIRSRSAQPDENLSGLVPKILKPLIKVAGKEFEEWVADPGWPHHVNKIRNEFGVAHFQGYANQSSPAPNFHATNEQIYTLLVLNILRDLGIENETIEKVIKRAGMPMATRI